MAQAHATKQVHLDSGLKQETNVNIRTSKTGGGMYIRGSSVAGGRVGE